MIKETKIYKYIAKILWLIYRFFRDVVFGPPEWPWLEARGKPAEFFEVNADTALKRFSMTDLLMPYRGWMFPGTAGVSQAERQTFMWMYSGILAATVWIHKINTVAAPAAVNTVLGADIASVSTV